MDQKVVEAVLLIGFLILSLGIHEAAHAWVAHRCGDDTARAQGRLTLNPISHIDPFMTIVLPAVLFMTTGFIFGGARPVPVNPYNLRHPLRDMMFVAVAGPLSNFLLAIVFCLVWKILIAAGMDPGSAWLGGPAGDLAPEVMRQAAVFNLILAIFNMLPIPPLDGSRVMAYLLPGGLRESYVGLDRFGMLIVFGLLYFGVLGRILSATIYPLWDAVNFLTGGAW